MPSMASCYTAVTGSGDSVTIVAFTGFAMTIIERRIIVAAAI
jgi:hypothetical protein